MVLEQCVAVDSACNGMDGRVLLHLMRMGQATSMHLPAAFSTGSAFAAVLMRHVVDREHRHAAVFPYVIPTHVLSIPAGTGNTGTK